MCLTRAYWAGIRRFVFALPQDSLPIHFYEGRNTNTKMVKLFNEKLTFIHLKKMEQEANGIVQHWLARQ